jgi:two-component system chemotaxis response regulator CheY
MVNRLPEEIRKLRFLVTDDYESMRIMIGDHLKQMGVENISFASSGNEALEFLKKNVNTPNSIEFVMTDLLMENGSGLDLVKGVRAEPSLSKLPVLMVTSKAEVTYVVECVKAGVSNYVVKPWQIEDLGKKIIDSYNKSKK